MIKKLYDKIFLSDKDVYLFQIDKNNLVVNKIVFNERSCGKKVNKWIKKNGNNWIISDSPVGGQYYPEYGLTFTAEIKPSFKKGHLWHLNSDRIWEPKISKPNDGKKYQFCEDCERWVESKCC